MNKNWLIYTTLILGIAFVSLSFKTLNNTENLNLAQQGLEYIYPNTPTEVERYEHSKIPFTGKLFVGFKEAVGFKESQGKYHKINSLGYMGKYQFGKSTLKTVGVRDSAAFMSNPRLQEKAFEALLAQNKFYLRDIIQKYDGKVVAGVYITESGILAAAHLGGPGSVRKFFNSNGKSYFKDAYGTSVRSYLKKFAGYDTSGIMAKKNARVTSI